MAIAAAEKADDEEWRWRELMGGRCRGRAGPSKRSEGVDAYELELELEEDMELNEDVEDVLEGVDDRLENSLSGGQKGDGRYRCCSAEINDGVNGRDEASSSARGRSGASKMSPLPERESVEAERVRRVARRLG